jgi:hypothetical protein
VLELKEMQVQASTLPILQKVCIRPKILLDSQFKVSILQVCYFKGVIPFSLLAL